MSISTEQIKEFQTKFEALCIEYAVPFFMSITFYRGEADDIRAMQIKECKTDDFTMLLLGTAAHNAALHALETVGRGKIMSETTKTKVNRKPETVEPKTPFNE